MQSFFTEYTVWKGFLYGFMLIYVLTAAAAVLIEPYLTLPCDQEACEHPLLFFRSHYHISLSYISLHDVV